MTKIEWGLYHTTGGSYPAAVIKRHGDGAVDVHVLTANHVRVVVAAGNEPGTFTPDVSTDDVVTSVEVPVPHG